MSDLSIPVRGMSQAMESFDRAAQRIARGSLATAETPGDTVELSTEMVNLLSARNDFKTNVKVAQTADEMNQSLLDILG